MQRSSWMSLILGLITHGDGIVASDGRLFGPAVLELGKVVKPALVESDEFDKTFSLGKGRLIGAYAGLMKFAGKNVAMHIEEIFEASARGETEFSRIIAKLVEGIESKLSKIDEQEVVFGCRKVDVLVIGRKSPRKRQLEIARLRFAPSDGTISHIVNIDSAGKVIRHCLFGDDDAQAAANRLLMSNRAPMRNAAFLENLAMRAMNAGIEYSGPQRYGSERACGEAIFIQTIRAK